MKPREPEKEKHKEGMMNLFSALKQKKESLTDYEMQLLLEKKGHKLYDPTVDNDVDNDELHKLGESYGYKFDSETYLWSK